MSGKSREQLLDVMGDVDESYIQEYVDAQKKAHGRKRMKMRFTVIPAAAIALLLGSVGLAAAIPAIGHFLANLKSEQQVIVRNFDEIEATYAVRIGDTQVCDGLVATLNSAIVEDRHLLLSYTFNLSSLEEAADGSFHTYFLPWFFYVAEGDKVICQSEHTKGLHTQSYVEDAGNLVELTQIYCIDLGEADGRKLVGKELTVRLLYARDGEGFTSAFTPETCFIGRSWDIDRTYEFDGQEITLDRVQESALYVTLFIDCPAIGHTGDDLAFVLSDELGNDYAAYPNGDSDTDGYWFTKPDTVGTQLTLKVIRSNMESDPYGNVTDDSYEVLYEIPIELKTPE